MITQQNRPNFGEFKDGLIVHIYTVTTVTVSTTQYKRLTKRVLFTQGSFSLQVYHNTFYKRILSTTTLCASLDIKFVPHAPKFQPEDKVDGSKRNLQNVSATFDSP